MRFPRMLRSTVLTLPCVSTQSFCGPSYLAATCSVLYVALECLKCVLCVRISRFISAFSAYWLDSGYILGVSLRGFGTSLIFFVKVFSSPVVNFVVVSVCQQRQVCTVQTVRALEIPQPNSSLVVDITVVAQRPFPLF